MNSVSFTGRLHTLLIHEETRYSNIDDFLIDPMKVTEECHMHIWGSVGVLFVDNRGGRSFYSDINPETKLPNLEYKLTFTKVSVSKPIINETNGKEKLIQLFVIYLAFCGSS